MCGIAGWISEKEDISKNKEVLQKMNEVQKHRGPDETSSDIIFASEIKALLEHPEIEPRLDKNGLREVLVMAPGRTPGNGVFRGIKELRPGYYMVRTPDSSTVDKYWSLKSEPHGDNLRETKKRIRDLFFDTVERQLISDVPICTFLSGGLDSSAITAVTQKYFSESLHTYSVDYEKNEKYFKKVNSSRILITNGLIWFQRV